MYPILDTTTSSRMFFDRFCDLPLGKRFVVSTRKLFVEEVFVTEGVPQFTFVPPPNFNEIFLDLRRPGKPLIIEGQSGTGKTTCVTKAIEKLGTAMAVTRLSSRRANDVSAIGKLIAEKPEGIFLIDDFHRLDTASQSELANIAKLAAEEGDEAIRLPKLILVGINQVGSELIHLVPDIAKRVGIHRIQAGREEDIAQLILAGCNRLGIRIDDWKTIFTESQGDYWLTQHLCQTLYCLQTNNVTFESQETEQSLNYRPSISSRQSYRKTTFWLSRRSKAGLPRSEISPK